MTRRTVIGGIIVSLAGSVFAATAGDAAFDPDRYLNHIKYLASPEMRGRESGSPELEKAAQYIAAQFKADGLKPVDGKSYLQAFEVTTSAKPGKGNRLDFSRRGRAAVAAVQQGFRAVQLFGARKSFRRSSLCRIRNHGARIQL